MCSVDDPPNSAREGKKPLATRDNTCEDERRVNDDFNLGFGVAVGGAAGGGGPGPVGLLFFHGTQN